MKKIIACLTFIVTSIFLCSVVYGETFFTKNFDVNVTVMDNGNLHVKEIISVDFLEMSHGIFRYIPFGGKPRFKVNNKEYRSKAIANIDHVDVEDEPYSTEEKSDNYIIKIGDKNKKILGPKTYYITYDIELINNAYKDFDIFYYNAIPTDWRSSIDEAKVSITFPKPIDPKKFEIYKGKFGNGEKLYDGITYKDNTVYFTLKKLQRKEGASAFIVLPKNYYVDPIKTDKYNKFYIGIAVSITAVFVILYFIYGKGEKLIKTVEFRPPKEVDPLLADYCVSQKVTNDDIIAVLMYLANKGFLRMEQIKNKNSKDKLDLKITKLQPPNINISYFIRGIYDKLFLNSSVICDDNGNKTVLFSKLSDDFWSSATKLIIAANSYCYGIDKKHYNKKTRSFKTLCLIAPVIYILLNLIFLSAKYSKDSVLGILFVPFFLFIVFYINLGFEKRNKYSNFRLFIKTLVYGVISLVLILFLCQFYGSTLDNKLLGLTIGIPSVIIIYIGAISKRYTEDGKSFYGKLLGFKDYIKTAELNRIKKLTLENPNYFFDILPYAMVFGLTDIWVNKFKGITIENPAWIYGDFNVLYMLNWYYFMSSTTASSINSMNIKIASKEISEVSSSSFGGGGTGGFTGGGFGGGGGGAW